MNTNKIRPTIFLKAAKILGAAENSLCMPVHGCCFALELAGANQNEANFFKRIFYEDSRKYTSGVFWWLIVEYTERVIALRLAYELAKECNKIREN